METMKLSKEAARAKYLYNKKYQNAYWERRAKRAQQPQQTERPQKGYICINRLDYKDADKYIAAIETSNRTLASENRRLISLLAKIQSPKCNNH